MRDQDEGDVVEVECVCGSTWRGSARRGMAVSSKNTLRAIGMCFTILQHLSIEEASSGSIGDAGGEIAGHWVSASQYCRD